MKTLPEFFSPMLATLSQPFDSPDYIFEVKWDGFRCLAFIDGSTRLQSRNNKSFSETFPELQNLHQHCRQRGLLLDGEVIALRDGKPNFQQLQKRSRQRDSLSIHQAAKSNPVVYMVFDLLYYEFEPIFNLPLKKRKTRLAETILPNEQLILTEYIEDRGLAYFQAITKLGLEGVIAKQKLSPYIPGKRSKTWLKFKRKQCGCFVVCGYILHSTSRGYLRSLLLGAYRTQELDFFGMVGTGFTQTQLRTIQQQLESIPSNNSPFNTLRIKIPTAIWVQPILICEVEFLELTDEGVLRHPVFKQFRPDLQPKDCQFEE